MASNSAAPDDAGLDEYLKGLRAKQKPPEAPVDPSGPDEATVKRLASGQRDPGPDWKRQLLDQGEEFGGSFLVGATHPWEEPSKDLSGPAYWGQEIGGYAPGVAASFIPGGALVKSGVGAVSGLTAPADSFSDRLVHGAEGAATGLLPAGLSRIPRDVFPSLDALAAAGGSMLFSHNPLHALMTGGGVGFLEHQLRPLMNRLGANSLSELAAKLASMTGVTGRAAAQGSDAAGVTGGEGSESRPP